ncbi:hypothetical protein ACFL18_01770 [Patescibacteria group bacterium]
MNKNIKLTDQEKKIEKALEKEEFQSFGLSKAKKFFKQLAENYRVQKDI